MQLSRTWHPTRLHIIIHLLAHDPHDTPTPSLCCMFLLTICLPAETAKYTDLFTYYILLIHGIVNLRVQLLSHSMGGHEHIAVEIALLNDKKIAMVQ